MGQPKTTSTTNAQATPTPEEQGMEKIQLGQMQQYAPAQTQMYQNAFGLGNQLLTSFGGQNSEQWKSLIGGVTSEQQQKMIGEQERLLKPQFQQQGIYDSGTAATARLRAATDLSNQNAQFNVGTLQNALNLALSGQAQIQTPSLGAQSQLAQSLAGLRANNNNLTNRGMNPFLQSFGQAGGNSLGGVNISMSYCWVASEIFGGWNEPKTCLVRKYIGNIAPEWFRNFYIKHGEKIAQFIHTKPILKLMLRPLFECFALMGKEVKYAY